MNLTTDDYRKILLASPERQMWFWQDGTLFHLRFTDPHRTTGSVQLEDPKGHVRSGSLPLIVKHIRRFGDVEPTCATCLPKKVPSIKIADDHNPVCHRH